MCWSASISLVTLALGTLGNAGAYVFFRTREPHTRTMLAYWQFCLQMQLSEGIAWLAIDDGRDSVVAARSAMIFNVFQPVVLVVAVWSLQTRVPMRGAIAVFMYAVLIATDTRDLLEASASIAPLANCTHLNLGYWDASRSALYVTASLFAFLDLQAVYWRWVNLGLFATTFVVALALYPCGGGSMWCWSIASSGPVLVLAWAVRRRMLS